MMTMMMAVSRGTPAPRF